MARRLLGLALWGAAAALMAQTPVAPAGAAEPAGDAGRPATTPALRELPQILGEADVRRYRRIFELGEAGAWDRVDALIGKLDNDILVGHALAQRYLHPSEYWTPFREAKAWMAEYHDLPYAPRLYRLAQQRRPEDAHGRIHRPTYGRGDGAVGGGDARRNIVGSIETLSTRASTPRARGILRQVRYNVLRTRLTITEAYLNRDDIAADLRPVEQDRGRAMVAAGWYYYGDDAEAAEPDAADAESLQHLTEIPAGRRALALLQVGERDRARRELLGIDGWDDPERVGTLLMAAERGGMAALAYRLGSRLAGAADARLAPAEVNAALYPIPPWRPATGFRMDRALLFALMRRVSRFQPRARSGAGARGLMHRPDLNLDLAQRYLRYLLQTKQVQGDLVRLVAAYNAGPGNLEHWLAHTPHQGDPLLFIESMPSRETRLFVERILTNLWVYRERLGQGAPSRAALASGAWPDYAGLDAGPQEVARK